MKTNDIITTIENKELGLKCNIAISNAGKYNVVFIDSDSNQMIQGTINIESYDKALAKANYYLNN